MGTETLGNAFSRQSPFHCPFDRRIRQTEELPVPKTPTGTYDGNALAGPIRSPHPSAPPAGRLTPLRSIPGGLRRSARS